MILLYVLENATDFSAGIRLDPIEDCPIAFAKNASEFKFFLETAGRMGYIESGNNVANFYRLSMDG